MDRPSQLAELKRIISGLEDGSASASALKDLALLCSDNQVQTGPLDLGLSISSYPDSPTPVVRKLGDGKTVWDEEKIFDRMFNALLEYLSAEQVSHFIAVVRIVSNTQFKTAGRGTRIRPHRTLGDFRESNFSYRRAGG